MAALEASFALTAPGPQPKLDKRLITLVAPELHTWLDRRAEEAGFRSTAAYVRALLEAHRSAIGADQPTASGRQEADAA